MGTFGQFETRPGDAGKRFPGGTVTYEARRPGEPEFRYLVKLVRRRSMTVDPQTGEIAPDRRVEEHRELFATQRELTRPRPAPAGKSGKPDPSEAPPRHWAALHDLGTNPDGAYAVLDHFDATLQKLVEVRQEPFASAELKHLVGSILAGLHELRSFGSRAHGKLKPSNVLLGRGKRGGAGKRLAGLPVVLSDLGPGREATEAGDVGALGEILYLCVTRAAFNPSDVAVDDSPEWQRLGPASRAWRELCARCVHPVPSQRPTLADAEGMLNAIKLPKSRRWRKVVAAAVLAALLAMGVGFKVWHDGNRALYQQYSGAYFGWARDTVDTLRTSIDPTAYGVGPAERLRAKFTRQYQKQPARPTDTGLRNNDRASDDPFWRGLLDRWERKPALHSPEEVRSVDPRSAPQLRQWLADVDSLRTEIAGWPALAQLAKAEAAFDRAGWASPRDVCRESRARVLHPLQLAPADLPPPKKKLELPDAVMSVAELERVAGGTIDGLVRQLDRLDALDAEIAGKTSDPKVKGLSALVKRDVAGAAAVAVTDPDTRAAARFDLEQVREDEARNLALKRALDKLNEDLSRAVVQVDAVAVRVRQDRWLGQGLPPPPDGGLSAELRLLSLVSANDALSANDPRADSKVPERLAALRQRLGGRDGGAAADWLERSRYAADTPAPDVKQARAAVTSAGDALSALERKLEAVRAMPFPKDALAIGAGLDELTKAADRFEAADLPAVATAVSKVRTVAEAYEQDKVKDDPTTDARQADRFAREGDAAAAAWAAWLPRLRAAADARKLSGGDRVKHYDAAADVLGKFLAEDPPAGPPAATNWAVQSFQARFVEDAAKAWPALKAGTLARRGKAPLLAADGRTVDPAALAPTIGEAREAYGQRVRSAVAVARAAGVLKERLARAERFTAPWVPADVAGDGGGGTMPVRGPLRQSAADLRAALDAAARAADAGGGTSAAGAAFAADAEVKGLQQSAIQFEPVEDADARLAASPPTFTADDRKTVVAALKRTDAPLELRYNAWLALRDLAAKRLPPAAGGAWPATAAELADEQVARKALAGDWVTRAPPLADLDAWRSGRREELRLAGPVTLRRYVETMAHGRPPAAVVKVVEAASDPTVAANFSTDAAGVRAGLSGPVKVALALDGARANTPEAGETGARKQAAALADELDDAAKWQPSAGDPSDFWSGRDAEASKLRLAYAGMAKQIRDRLAGQAAKPADPPPVAAVVAPDFAAAGLGALGWKPAPGAGGAVVYTYVVAGQKPVAIAFAPVPGAPPSAGQPTPYLATTELSIEMANAVMASASARTNPPVDLWRRCLSLAKVQEGTDTTNIGQDPEDRPGPRAWRWSPGKAGQPGTLVKTQGWMMETLTKPHYTRTGSRNDLLPADAPGGNPDASHPFHRLSPAEAVYVAAVANARLPTVGEWKLAYATEAAANPSVPWNLRDAAFAEQVSYIGPMTADPKTRVAGANPPDAGIFWPRDGVADAKSGVNAQTSPAVPKDGTLWFAPVNKGWTAAGQPGDAPGKVFKHLVGNVAEFVAKGQPVQPREIALEPKRAGDWARTGSPVAVMGLSALSPPQYTLAGGATADAAPDVPFDADGSLDGERKSKVAYTDVGIRLAIDVPGGGGSPMAVQQQPPETLGDWFKKWAEQASPWPS